MEGKHGRKLPINDCLQMKFAILISERNLIFS